jgi:predicted nucleotidyltransferase
MDEGQKIASEFAARARRQLPHGLLEVRLFGSAARGTLTPESDIDLFVLVQERTPAVLDALYDIAFELTVCTRRDVSLKVYDTARYNRSRAAGSGFVRALERESVLLWSAQT